MKYQKKSTKEVLELFVFLKQIEKRMSAVVMSGMTCASAINTKKIGGLVSYSSGCAKSLVSGSLRDMG